MQTYYIMKFYLGFEIIIVYVHYLNFIKTLEEFNKINTFDLKIWDAFGYENFSLGF